MDPFDEFFEMATELAKSRVAPGVDNQPECIISKDNKLTVAMLMVPPRFYRGNIQELVEEVQADCYAVIAEVWRSEPKAGEPLVLPMNDPNNREAIVIVAYHRDGRTKDAGFYITKDHQVTDEPCNVIPDLKDRVLGGNVFRSSG